MQVKRRQNAVALYQQQGISATNQPSFNAGPQHYAASRYMPETVYSTSATGQTNAHAGGSTPIRRF
jgi:hypothetical protein